MAEDMQKSGEILLYNNGGEKELVSVLCKDENVWATQKAMAELLDTSKQNISLHLKNCFHKVELCVHSVVKEFLTTAADGKNYNTSLNLTVRPKNIGRAVMCSD